MVMVPDHVPEMTRAKFRTSSTPVMRMALVNELDADRDALTVWPVENRRNRAPTWLAVPLAGAWAT